MRLLSILLLCSYCLQSFSDLAPTIYADCDDVNIFDAVDEALQSFNRGKVDGNKFILYRITEAKTRNEEPSLVHNFVTFDIRESVCPLKDALPWKKCDFKLDDPERGECHAHVLFNLERNTKEVFSQNCLITPKVTEPPVHAAVAPCLGCYLPISFDNKELLALLEFAIERMNKRGNHPFYFDLEEVVKATRQVVKGVNYKLVYNIRQTNCLKSVYTTFSPEECKIDLNGQTGNCDTDIFVDHYGEIKDTDLKCVSSSGFCLNCPDAVEPNNPVVQKVTKDFVEKYNSKSNFTVLYAVDKDLKATQKLKSDYKQYLLEFNMQSTNCSKSEHAELDHDCAVQPKTTDNYLICKMTVDVFNETTSIVLNSTCEPHSNTRATMKGYSPLRTLIPLRRGARASEKSKGKGHGQNQHKEEDKHGKKDKKDKKDKEKGKKNKDGKKDRSSEESYEDNRSKPQTPTKQPIVPNKDVTHPPLTEEITKLPIVQSSTTATPKLPSSSPDLQDPLNPNLPLTTAATVLQDNEGILPGIDETILDLPLPQPPNVRKCPGKEWKPLLPIPPIPTDIPFVIGDLFPAMEDLAPPEDNFPEKSIDISPPRPFSDDDLLSALDF